MQNATLSASFFEESRIKALSLQREGETALLLWLRLFFTAVREDSDGKLMLYGTVAHDENGYREDIDFIAGILRQEVLAIYHPADIAKLVHETVAELTEKQASRIEKKQMKLGKISAASYFLLARVLMELYRNDNPADFATLVEKAGTMGVEFMKQKNSTINEILRDGEHICRMAEQCL